MLQDHIWNAYCSRSMFAMLLEQYAFQIWSWSIFDLEMVLDHKLKPKCQKSVEEGDSLELNKSGSQKN